jgi:ribonuclease BN (tRNA processing enzyme)
MRLTVLGAGPAYSDDPDSAGAAYLIQHDGAALVLDLGHGAFARLSARVGPERLAGIAISHLHPDHFIDLVPLRHWLRYHLAEPGRVTVHGPRGLAARLDALHDEPGFAAAALDFETLAPGSRWIGPFRLEIACVQHTADSYAFRVSTGADEGGPGLVYSGDVGRAGDLEPLIRAGDLLLVEVSFGPGPVPAGVEHLDGPAVGDLAARTRPARVLLTHLLPDRDRGATLASVRARFDGPVELVFPGTVADW